MGNMMHRGKGSFTHVENTVFFDHALSLKAKGIYCQIRSLENNPEWVFTIRGFATLVKDGVDAVTAGLKELESAGYIIRARRRSENGRFLKAEEATWITLDDPAMYANVAAELKEEGYAILFWRYGWPQEFPARHQNGKIRIWKSHIWENHIWEIGPNKLLIR